MARMNNKKKDPKTGSAPFSPLSGNAYDLVVDNAYDARSREITSLRLYDKGEKEIHAPDLRTIVQRV
jgi:hypothetical protein